MVKNKENTWLIEIQKQILRMDNPLFKLGYKSEGWAERIKIRFVKYERFMILFHVNKITFIYLTTLKYESVYTDTWENFIIQKWNRLAVMFNDSLENF